MGSTRRFPFAWRALSLCCGLLPDAASHAAAFPEFADPNPSPGDGFGSQVVVLSTGNVVIAAPTDDAGAVNAGAVYLFNGTTGALISTLRGSSSNDVIGSGGIFALTNGNFLVASPGWRNVSVVGAGAVTWGSGTTGVSGAISAANSLVGSSANDNVGSVTTLTNGNYLVTTRFWDNGGLADAGAATWANGATGITGTISAANSLVGSKANDQVGLSATPLSNGNYVVESHLWDNGAVVDVGAVTWGNGTAGVTGSISAVNSLLGATASDQVGSAGAANSGVTALPNGNYLVESANWDNGAVVNTGAVTLCNGASGTAGAVSAANSLVGSTANDQIGANGGASTVTVLTNGNYVVRSVNWDNGAASNASAVTWGSATTGVTGAVSAANSLVGTTTNDLVGNLGVVTLTNGNYVVRSPNWDNGAIVDAGAATWGSGTAGVTGAVSAANSLVGSTASDQVSVAGAGITALTNGNYVVLASLWDNGAIANAGAATWGNGATGVTGTISAANSLVGSIASDQVGSSVTALTNGNYVVGSSNWHIGASTFGAATWGNGATGLTGTISAANSLVGGTASDNVASAGVIALSNGNYVVCSQFWDNNGLVDVGAATWGNGTTGTTGTVSPTNSLIGATGTDGVGQGGATALTNGNYVVRSPQYDYGNVVDAGATTWGNGATGTTGAVSQANSLVGSTTSDGVGIVLALSNGNYVVTSGNWDNGALVNAGAATWGSGTTGVSGVISAANSLVGGIANSNLQNPIEDAVNGTFISRFLNEARVRVGPTNSPAITSAVDVPGDQGGWLRLTFTRCSLDDVKGVPQGTSYGIWRHIPGTVPAGARRAVAQGSAANAKLLASLPPAFQAWATEGRVFANGSGPRSAQIATSFPPGTWELVTSVPATQQTQYVAVAPTTSNGNSNDFVVTAHTTMPSVWFISNTASGQSLDNLVPAQPTGLTAAYSSGQTNLQWAANTEPDLGSYRLYRGASAGFTPSPGNRIATPTGTSFADVGAAGGYYKLSAVDVNGNESAFALVTPDGTTGVGAGAPVLALAGVRPNPTRGEGLHVAFELASAAPALLELLDLGGRRVRTREVGSLGAGPHEVDLADARGIQAGIYWVRLTQGGQRKKLRVAVIE